MFGSIFVLSLSISALDGVQFRSDRQPPSFPELASIDEIAAKAGYSTTPYEVITDDGYSLWLFRIGNKTGAPVLMQHGAFVAADSWITRGKNKDLAFILLQEGYDVWLSNERGTVYNEYSTNYHRKDPRFWNFSFHESGYFDIPAFIDTILEVRKAKQLFYIGHSLGTTVFTVMASTRPDYNSKVKAAILLSPVVFPPSDEEMDPRLSAFLKVSDIIFANLFISGQFEVAPRTFLSVASLRKICAESGITKKVCQDFMGMISGEDRANLDDEDWDNFIPYYGAGTSLKTLYHMVQLLKTGEFKQFDYGPEGNLFLYQNWQPPFYQLDLVKTPVALFWSYNDPLIFETSVARLSSQLPHVVLSKAVPDSGFNHIDMYLGANANKILYPSIISLMKNY